MTLNQENRLTYRNSMVTTASTSAITHSSRSAHQIFSPVYREEILDEHLEDCSEYFASDEKFSTHNQQCEDQASTGCNTQYDSSYDRNDELPIAFLPRQHVWMNRMPTVLAGSAAIATSAGLIYTEVSSPQFEGHIQLSPQVQLDETRVSFSLAETETAFVASPETGSPYSIDLPEHIHFLESMVLPGASMRLTEIGLSVTPQHLAQQTDIQWSNSGTLDVSYQANSASQVNHVLRAIALTYEQQTGQCQSQICLNANYIKEQIPKTEQEIERLRAELVDFEQKHQLINIRQSQPSLEAKARELMRVQDDTRHELRLAQAKLSNEQSVLEMSPSDNTAVTLLKTSPHYHSLMQTWQQIDQQILIGLINNIDELSNAEHIQQHETITKQLYGEIHHHTQHFYSLDVPSTLWHLILEKPERLETVKAWLNLAQRVQLIQIRQQNLAHVLSTLNTQIQNRRSLLVQYERIEENMYTAAQTLAGYQQRLEVLQQKASNEQMAWQLVAPPEVMETSTPMTQVRQWFSQYLRQDTYAQETPSFEHVAN